MCVCEWQGGGELYEDRAGMYILEPAPYPSTIAVHICDNSSLSRPMPCEICFRIFLSAILDTSQVVVARSRGVPMHILKGSTASSGDL